MAKLPKQKNDIQGRSVCNGSSSQHVQPNSSKFDQSTQEALSKLFAREQQTYEEFLNSFTCLKKEDILNNFVATSLNTPNGDIVEKDIFIMAENQQTAVQTTICTNGVDELIQEDLSPGSVTASFLLRNDDSTHPKIQLRPAQTSLFVILLYLMPDDVTRQGRASGWERVNDTTTVPLYHDWTYKLPASGQLDNFVDNESLETTNSGGYHPTLCEKSKKDSVTERISSSLNNTDAPCTASIKEICLPGEIESDCTSTALPIHLRCLDIRTQKLNEGERTKEEEMKCSSDVYPETESCEVETFHLDTDFDYDNVQVTPKFDFLFKQI